MKAFAACLAPSVLLAVSAAPRLAAAQEDSVCAVLSRVGDHYARTPLPGFDPATAPAPLTAPIPQGGRALVLCHRPDILPEPTDYRVPAELHVPLAITDERKVLVLDLVDGRLDAGFRRGQPSPDEAAAVKARVEQMQAAMEKAGNGK